jgi:hypothetical protein
MWGSDDAQRWWNGENLCLIVVQIDIRSINSVCHENKNKTKSIVWQTLDSRCPTFTGCGCLPKQSVTICSSTNFARKLQDGPVDFAARRLVLGHSDKRRVVADIGVYLVSLWTVVISLSLSCYQSSFDACHY